MYYENGQLSILEVVEKHRKLVKKIAHHLLARLPASIELEDLLQAGMIGLLEASRNYSVDKGASFETYAAIRIKGSMLDEIRKGDWTPRSVHKKNRQVAKVMHMLEHKLGRDAKSAEIAEVLKISLKEYHQILQDANRARVFAFNDLTPDESSSDEHFPAALPGPLDKVQMENFKAHMAENIATLPEKERLVLGLYYHEELNLKEVACVLGVSESRISQIHGQAMLRLQARLTK